MQGQKFSEDLAFLAFLALMILYSLQYRHSKKAKNDFILKQ
jgi:hypothetical protein